MLSHSVWLVASPQSAHGSSLDPDDVLDSELDVSEELPAVVSGVVLLSVAEVDEGGSVDGTTVSPAVSEDSVVELDVASLPPCDVGVAESPQPEIVTANMMTWVILMCLTTPSRSGKVSTYRSFAYTYQSGHRGRVRKRFVYFFASVAGYVASSLSTSVGATLRSHSRMSAKA
jgi:hypothetical protein